MAHVNEIRSFTYHPCLSTGGMNYTSPAAERHRTLAGTHFPSH